MPPLPYQLFSVHTLYLCFPCYLLLLAISTAASWFILCIVSFFIKFTYPHHPFTLFKHCICRLQSALIIIALFCIVHHVLLCWSHHWVQDSHCFLALFSSLRRDSSWLVISLQLQTIIIKSVTIQPVVYLSFAHPFP